MFRKVLVSLAYVAAALCVIVTERVELSTMLHWGYSRRFLLLLGFVSAVPLDKPAPS